MIYKGVIGAKLIVDVTGDISSGTVFKIYYRKPDGTTGSWTATKESNNTSISYTTTLASDLDQVGKWTLQSYSEVGGWKGYGEVTQELEVNENSSIETITLTSGTNTWATIAEAEIYFRTRLGASTFWNNSADKPAALVTAYKYLINCGLFYFPDTATEVMKDAQCEMALFLLQHMADMDARKGLQAQGVTQAGIVQESYDKDKAGEMAIPAIVSNMLEEHETGSPLYQADAKRHDHHEC